jgi:tripeptidyl-peptidase-1
MLAVSAAMWNLVPMERANPHPKWIQQRRAEGTRMHEVMFAVKQRNLDVLDKILIEVSDPRSPLYGKHLTFEQVGKITANPEATSDITRWLTTLGAEIVSMTPRGEYIKAKAPISLWEDVFGTEFYSYAHATLGEEYRAEHYNLPAGKEEMLSAVFNTVQFPVETSPMILTPASGLRATPLTTPDLLNSYYQITNNDGNNKGSQSVYESLSQYFSPSDLSDFQTKYDLPQDEVDEVIGGHESDSKCVNPNNCAEANLDVQYIMAVAQNVPTTYWYSNSFLGWINDVASDSNPPLVHSISYGSVEDTYPASLANAFNTEAAKLGTMGITVLVSSGDDGVANFNARDDASECGYHPSFPASSPYVTAVGATSGPEAGTTEIACTSDTGGLITTGGGFSTIFAQPSWQSSAVSGYFSSLSSSQTPESGYNAQGRGYPDVAMLGHNYAVVIGGKTQILSGTSASSPVVAGMVALVNANRLAAGKSSLGFLNPAIYQNGGIFNDITSGENNCAAGSPPDVCCDEGFYASSGWDPVTGFGSVDFTNFNAVFSQL